MSSVQRLVVFEDLLEVMRPPQWIKRSIRWRLLVREAQTGVRFWQV
jgi:hypothetical protein